MSGSADIPARADSTSAGAPEVGTVPGSRPAVSGIAKTYVHVHGPDTYLAG